MTKRLARAGNDHGGAGVTRADLLKGTLAGAAMLGVPGLLAACGSSSPAPGSGSITGRGGGGQVAEARWGMAATIGNLDLRKQFLTPVAAVLVQEGLFTLDPSGRRRPALALRQTSIDPLTYAYDLRPGVRFSDGSPLTATDVAASLNADRADGTQLAGLGSSIRSVSADGENRVVVRLKELDERFQDALITGNCTIMPRGELSRRDTGTRTGRIVGTGPYLVESFIPDTSVTFVANPHYWGPKPAVQRLVLTMIPDDATRLNAMQSGELDGAFGVPVAQLESWQSIPDVAVQPISSLETTTLYFNTAMAPFDDVHARRALAYCWDRRGLVNAILKGHGSVAYSLPVGDQWRSALSAEEAEQVYRKIPQYDLDMAKAKEELSASRTPGGYRAELQYPTGHQQLGLALQALQKRAAEIGIKLTVREVAPGGWEESVVGHRPAVSVLPTVAGTSDVAEKVGIYYDSRYAKPGPFGFANYRNPAVDALIRRAGRELDARKRALILGDALATAAPDVPYAPLWWPQTGVAVKKSKLSFAQLGAFSQLQPWATDLRSPA